jgi:hypothetical protein
VFTTEYTSTYCTLLLTLRMNIRRWNGKYVGWWWVWNKVFASTYSMVPWQYWALFWQRSCRSLSTCTCLNTLIPRNIKENTKDLNVWWKHTGHLMYCFKCGCHIRVRSSIVDGACFLEVGHSSFLAVPGVHLQTRKKTSTNLNAKSLH